MNTIIIKSGIALPIRRAGVTIYVIAENPVEGQYLIRKHFATLQLAQAVVGQVNWVIGSFSDAGFTPLFVWHPSRYVLAWVAWPRPVGVPRLQSVVVQQFSTLTWHNTKLNWKSMKAYDLDKASGDTTPDSFLYLIFYTSLQPKSPAYGLQYVPNLIASPITWTYVLSGAELTYTPTQMAALMAACFNTIEEGGTAYNVGSTLFLRQPYFNLPSDAADQYPIVVWSLFPETESVVGTVVTNGYPAYLGEEEWFH